MKKSIYFVVWLVIPIFGCSHFKSSLSGDAVVARIGDKTLLRRELTEILPQGITRPDSIAQSRDYINRWIKKELMLRTAEENLAEDQKDVQRELDEYRTSLIIHRYQQQLISQKLDTVVTESDIQRFYDQHPDQFTLDQNLVKAIYIEVPKKMTKLDQLRRWMSATDDKSRTELERFSFQFANKFDYFNDQWIDFSQIRSRMPVGGTNSQTSLKKNTLLESADANKCYLAAIKDVRLIGEKEPFEYAKDRIANLIITNRKMVLIQDLEKNIYQKGKKENIFKED